MIPHAILQQFIRINGPGLQTGSQIWSTLQSCVRVASSKRQFPAAHAPIGSVSWCNLVVMSGLLLLLAGFVSPCISQTIEWSRQLGTPEFDTGAFIAIDEGGSVFMSGSTYGDFAGPNAGFTDVYLAKYDTNGELQWTRQFGTETFDLNEATGTDGLGNVYLAGRTSGNLGGMNMGASDAFVTKYDGFGTQHWSKQFGTTENEAIHGVTADGLGSVYTCGGTQGDLDGTQIGENDAFVAKFNDGGLLQWIRQFGTSEHETCWDISADRLGNVYVTGVTQGSLGAPQAGLGDVYLAKLDSFGNLNWKQQIGTPSRDTGFEVAVDGWGDVVISGLTEGSLAATNAGESDAFVAKYDGSGKQLWMRQLGSDGFEVGRVSTDGDGNVYLGSPTTGNVGGTNAGDWDSFLAKYDRDGSLQWIHQFGTNFADEVLDISSDRLGNVYLSGGTSGSLGAANAGGYDPFIAKFLVPEPSYVGTLIVTMALALVRRHSHVSCTQSP